MVIQTCRSWLKGYKAQSTDFFGVHKREEFKKQEQQRRRWGGSRRQHRDVRDKKREWYWICAYPSCRLSDIHTHTQDVDTGWELYFCSSLTGISPRHRLISQPLHTEPLLSSTILRTVKCRWCGECAALVCRCACMGFLEVDRQQASRRREKSKLLEKKRMTGTK